MKQWQFGTMAVLIVGLISAVLYSARNSESEKVDGGGGKGQPLIKECPVHGVVPLDSYHWPCGYQHGEVVFVNDLHEGDVTVTIDTGHDKGKFCDHTEHELVKVLHHAEVVVLTGMANGSKEFTLRTFDGETFRGHVTVEPDKQIRCGVIRGPNGVLTCDILIEDHEEEGEH